MKALLFSVTATLLSVSVAQAQLTWDPDNDQVSNGGTGTWDTATSNWDDDGSAPNTTWVNGGSAVFGDYTANYTVDLAAGVSVTNLTYEGTNTLWLKALVDNTALTLAGDAAWDTGGANIRFLNNTVNDTPLDLAGNTLTVNGGGLFDTGEKGNGANWGSGDLILTEATTLRGAAFSVGQLNSVTIADGSKFWMERNSNQDINCDWVLNGDVRFDNRWNGRTTWANGEISGPGRLVVEGMGTSANSGAGFLRINNTNNTFEGGITVNGSINNTVLLISGVEAVMGTAPTSYVADHIILKDGGILKMGNKNLNPNWGITLEGSGGVIVNSGSPNTINGKITGAGGLTVGRASDGAANTTILTTNVNDYAGETRVLRGSLQLNVDNALPTNTVVNIGGAAGGNLSELRLNGKNQTITGLYTSGGNTRRIRNIDTNNVSTLTINIASGSRTYAGNFGQNTSNSGDIALVKEGAGTQQLSGGGGYSIDLLSLTINEGRLEQNRTSFRAPVTVNSGGILGGTGTTVSNVVVNTGGGISPGNGGGWNKVKIQADLDLSGMIDDNAGGLEIGFGADRDWIVVTNAAGTATANLNGPGIFDIQFSDFNFTHNAAYDLASGEYPILIADILQGNLDPLNKSGDVGTAGATGTLSVSNNTIYLTVVSSPYNNWANTYELSGGANDDDDSDGYDNFQEFAYGGDPTNAADTGHAPVMGTEDVGGTNWLTLAYGYMSDTNGPVDYTCLTTADLMVPAWTNAGITVLGTNTIDATFDSITNAIPIDGTKDFLGVFIEEQ